MTILTRFVSLFFIPLLLSAEIKDTATGEVFPSDVQFTYEGKSYDLRATGVATRKKLIVKVYSVASYLQKDAKGADTLSKVMSADNAKQLTIKWVRDVPAAKIVETYRESFTTVLGDKSKAGIDQEVDKFLSFFTKDAAKGGELVLRWIPAGHVEVWIDGNKAGSIDSEIFAKALWSIWFGKKSVVNADQLLSQS